VQQFICHEIYRKLLHTLQHRDLIPSDGKQKTLS